MFGSDKKAVAVAAGVPTGITLIAEQCTFKGDVRFTGGKLFVEGRVIGSVVAEAGSAAEISIIGKGSVDGEVRGPKIVIDGQVDGNIISTERVSLMSRARVNGNLYYKVLEMAAGAQVNGQIRRVDEGQTIEIKSEAVAAIAAPAAAPAVINAPAIPAVAATPAPEPLKLDGNPDSKLSVSVEPSKESKVEAVVVTKEGRHKRDK